MWRNYLTVGVRALTRNRVYPFINVFGLAIGVAAALLIFLYVRYETTYDAWLPDSERVFQVQMFGDDPETGERIAAQGSPGPMAHALGRSFPQIEAITRVDFARPALIHNGETFASEGYRQVDESFFDILQLPFLRGDRANALRGMDSLAISRREAMRIFGTLDVVGRTLTRVENGHRREMRITGVFEDLPRNSHLDFTMIARWNEAEAVPCGWSCINGDAYAKLRPGVSVESINRQMPAFEARNVTPENIGGARVSEADHNDWRLTNVRDVHLGEAQRMSDRPGNDRRTVITFAVVALMILGMAIVNFVNLATARAGRRAREVALRKVLGARRGQLVTQFLAESMLIAGIAVVLALAATEVSAPWLSGFLDLDLRIHYLGADGLLLPILLLWLLVGLTGGLYPAFHLSRYAPAEILKANQLTVDPHAGGRLRTALVVAQFAVAIGLIVCTIVVYSQAVFARTTDPGFRRDGLLLVEGLNRPEILMGQHAFIREASRVQGVTAAAGSQLVPASRQTLYTRVQVPGRADPVKLGWYSVDPNFFRTMGIRMLAGRPLSPAFAKDNAAIDYEHLTEQAQADAAARNIVARGLNVVLNAQAARQIGFADPAAAIGRRFRLSLFGDDFGATDATIVGVAADSRLRSLHEPIEPVIFYDTGLYSRLILRYHAIDPRAVRERVGAVWKRLYPEVPFEADFADERLDEVYAADARRSEIFAGFTLLAVVIACMGLGGLAALNAERRTREIGIRKVFGARARDIVRMFAWQFSKPVLIANLVAWPVAWWAMRGWLNTYDLRSDLGPLPFVLAALLALVIAVGTTAGHAVKVARANPIHALRYE